MATDRWGDLHLEPRIHAIIYIYIHIYKYMPNVYIYIYILADYVRSCK